MSADARRLDHKTLTELRELAVDSIQGSQSPASAGAAFGFSERTLYQWLAAYRNGGWGKQDVRKRAPRSSTPLLRRPSRHDPARYCWARAFQ